MLCSYTSSRSVPGTEAAPSPDFDFQFFQQAERVASTGRICAEGCKGIRINQATFATYGGGGNRCAANGDCNKTHAVGRGLNGALVERRRGNN